VKNTDRGYPVVYSDFPWSFKNKKTGGSHKSGSSQKYSTMSLQEIKEFPIHDIIGDHGIHFMWVPVPLKFEAVEAINTWGGFTYKTSIIWKKVDGIGMGWWARGVIEELWILVKGNIKALRWQGKNILEETDPGIRMPVGFIKAKTSKIHSRKPERMYDIIEEMIAPVPELSPRVELFATNGRPGWISVGHELGSDAYEFSRHLNLRDGPKKQCAICGNDLALSKEDGCFEGSCSTRIPIKLPNFFYDPYRARLEGSLEPIKVAA